MHNCGPWWFPQKVKAWFSKDFNHACGVHDLMYEEQEGKIRSDSVFLMLMLEKAKSDRKRYFQLQLKAWGYFILVFIFGFISYNREKFLKNKKNRG